jgi:hypothetical protein
VKAAEGLRITNGAIDEDLEQRRGGIGGAVENLVTARVPAGRCKQPPSPIEGEVLCKPPDDH